MQTTVGFLIDRWDPERGGAERALAQLAAHLEAGGQRVLAFAASGDPEAPGELRLVRPRGHTRARVERHLAAALPAAAREAGCDVTVGIRHLEEVDLYWPHAGLHAAAVAARRGESEPRLSGRHRVFVDLERGLLEGGRARRIVCVSERVRAELVGAYPACAERLVVIENGVDLARFHPRLREDAAVRLRTDLELEAGIPLLVFVAREPRAKGLVPLLDALSGLRDLDWHLLIAGPRRTGPVHSLARKHLRGLERVSVRAHVPAPRLLAGADLCVLPTYRDPCPLVVLEALASGTPVVTTRHAGNARVVAGGIAGAVVDEPEGPALAEALQEWILRISSAPPDRLALRACVEQHGDRAWLEAVAQEVLALGPGPPR